MPPLAIPGAVLALGIAFLPLPLHAAGPAPLASEACLGCHGPAGRGATGTPPLAGRDRAELVAILVAFRGNERPGTIMGRIARGYTDAEIAAIADHFARQR